MEGYEAFTYGDRIAAEFDRMYEFDPAPAVGLLSSLAAEGRALELGVGTGRVAIPLTERGIEVHGIDASRAMLAKLRTKEGGDRVVCVQGDFARAPVSGPYDVVYVVFNTFFALPTQQDQIACLAGVHRVLAPGGGFVVELFVPDPALFEHNQRVVVERIGLDGFTIQVGRLDPIAQRIDGQIARFTQEGVRLFPLSLRYAFVSEMDLMARLAGLRLRDRWASWTREPFTSNSRSHISVYERAAS